MMAIIMPTWVILIPTVGLKFLGTSLYYNAISSGQFLGEFAVNICKKKPFFYFEKKSKSALEHLK